MAVAGKGSEKLGKPGENWGKTGDAPLVSHLLLHIAGIALSIRKTGDAPLVSRFLLHVEGIAFDPITTKGENPGNEGGVPGFPSAPRQKFTGKERDAESGLDYFGARYLASAQGRFTSADPLNIPNLRTLAPEKFQAIIANPHNWNAYAYAHNNPLAKMDPDGYLTIIVPGTWNNHAEWEESEFRKKVEQSFGEKALILDNRGLKDSARARAKAAEMIVDLVKKHKFTEGEKLNIVAHSHGGNAVFEATKQGLNHKIDTLVTLGTPIRSDYIPNQAMIGQHLNVFSNSDQIQPLGGIRYSIPGSVIPAIVPARRTLTLPGVQNLDATSYASGHSVFWQDTKTWEKVVTPKLKK
ncbi:MAG: hypothetical protein HYX74_09950 [Acidobacteria bacterium]|nr:hypothetical protein [Acidobacteriota bacterium]